MVDDKGNAYELVTTVGAEESGEEMTCGVDNLVEMDALDVDKTDHGPRSGAEAHKHFL